MNVFNGAPYTPRKDQFNPDEFDRIIAEYSPKKTTVTRPAYEFDPNSPTEIITGSILKLGQREVSDWGSKFECRSSSMKPKLESSTSRHKATKEKGLALYQNMKNRIPERECAVDPEPPPPDNADILRNHKKWSNVTVSSRRGNAAYFHLFNSASKATSVVSDSQEYSEDEGSDEHDICEGSVESGVSDLTLPRLDSTHVAIAAANAAALMSNTASATRNRKARIGTVRNMRSHRLSKLNPKKGQTASLPPADSRYSQSKVKSDGVQLPPLSPEQSKKYFGQGSRKQFYDTYRDLHHIRHDLVGAAEDFDNVLGQELPNLDKEIDDQSENWSWANSQLEDEEKSVLGCRRSFDPASPRAKYLAGCLRSGMPPRCAILLRGEMSTALWLDHQGMGDRLGMLFATGLSDIPMVTSLNLTDNNLSDVSLTAIIKVVATTPTITDLNLSQNVIGTSAANALAEYLRHKSCTIKKLTLKAANVDDGECHKFVEALGENRVLEELDLSENLLGKDENLNAVKPDVVTGGESLGILLHDCRCPIRKLKIAWNMIRMEGARELCRALQYQRFLKHLDVSFNSLGRESAVVLGNALLDNEVLEELIVANNNIDAIGCFALCVGVREGRSIRYMNIDGNPIGEPGGRMLMTLPVACGSRVTFSAKNCDVTVRQESCWFNKSEPLGVYELDMADGYELAIMYELLDIVAKHPSYQFVQVLFGDDRDAKNWEPMPFVVIEEKVTNSSAAEMKLLSALKKNLEIAENVDSCSGYFAMAAGDSGDLNEEQFYKLLDQIGFVLDERKKASIMSICDTDRSGEVQIEEFLDFLAEITRDTKLRIRDIETVARCALESDPQMRYIPPRLGVFRITIGDSYTFGDESRALTADQVQHLLAMSKNTSDSAKLLQYAAQADLLRMDEAQDLYNNIVTDNGDPAGTLAILLPHMAVSSDAQNLSTVCAPDDDSVRKRIKTQLGQAYRAIMGIPNGYYSLDLSKESDRICMTKLLELSTTGAARRLQMGLGDVSQDGNWSSFRNEYFAGREIRLTLSSLTPMPTQGKIEFDFVTSERPSPHVVCLTDRKIIQMLCHCKLLLPKHVHWAYDELSDMRRAVKKSLVSPGYSPLFSRTVGRMLEAQNYKHNCFYTKLDQRAEQTERSVKKEQHQMLVRMPTRLTAMDSSDFTSESVNLDEQSTESMLYAVDEFESLLLEEDSALNTDISTGENMVQESLQTIQKAGSMLVPDSDDMEDALNSITTPPTLKKKKKGARTSDAPSQKQIVYENGPQVCAKCAKIVELLETTFASKYIYSRHLALITRSFRIGTLKKTDFGTYRVEAIVSLFPRVKDTHNFELVLATMTAEEHGMLLARLGMLGILDPLRPEGGHCLDLSVWEERQVAKMLVHLAAVEPGVNWHSECFQFDRTTKRIPGWVLPVTWYTEAGLPSKGILSMEYYSGHGLRLNGCNPAMKDREALLSLVLHRHDLVVIDENGFCPLVHGSDHINIGAATVLLKACGPPEIEWDYAPLKEYHE